jgi:signal transduction histidine kinase
MEVLVKDMLALSRMIRSELRRERTDLSQMARDIGAELLLDELERLMEFDVTPDLIVECDPHLLKVALANLLENVEIHPQNR